MSLRASLIVLFVGALLPAGCSREVPTSPTETNIHKIAILYGRYIAGHRGRPPANEQALRQFIRSLDAPALSSMGIDPGALDALFTSPRDGQPFVIRYGVSSMPAPGSTNAPVIVYEKTGSDGKRYVAFATTQVELVDEARFRELVPAAR